MEQDQCALATPSFGEANEVSELVGQLKVGYGFSDGPPGREAFVDGVSRIDQLAHLMPLNRLRPTNSGQIAFWGPYCLMT